MFMLDYKMFSGSSVDAPSRQAFIEEVLPQLDRLKEIVLEEGQHQNGNGTNCKYYIAMSASYRTGDPR